MNLVQESYFICERERCTDGNRRSLENLIPHNINAASKRRNGHLKVILHVNIGLVIFRIVCCGPSLVLCRRVVMGSVIELVFIGIAFLLKKSLHQVHFINLDVLYNM